VLPRDIPAFPIAAVLEEFGFENVPHLRTGFAKVLCIFHPDTTPSATVSRYGFKCWACGRSGDSIKLLREEEGLSFAAAIERAAEITGVTSGGSGEASRQGADLLALPGIDR
jgi:DNA primase